MSDDVSTRMVLRSPSAWLPLLLSAAALAMVVVYAATFGTTYHADEGAPARLFQLLVLSDVLLVALFAIRWLPRAPRPTGLVIALQVAAISAPVLTIMFLEARATG